MGGKDLLNSCFEWGIMDKILERFDSAVVAISVFQRSKNFGGDYCVKVVYTDSPHKAPRLETGFRSVFEATRRAKVLFQCYGANQYDGLIALYESDGLEVDTNLSRDFEQWLEDRRDEQEDNYDLAYETREDK